jgi:hypothetical protein
MKNDDIIAILLIVIVFIMLIIPFGLIILTFPAESYRVTGGEPVRDAAGTSGLSVCSVTDAKWNLTGATAGKSYLISDNCASPSSTNAVTIHVQTFDSESTRDAAIHLHNQMSIGKGKPVSRVTVVGDSIVYITPYDTNLSTRIVDELKIKNRQ